MLIPKKVFKKTGLFDSKRLPQYAADNEFAIRAARFGFRPCVFMGAKLLSDTKCTGLKFTPSMKLSIKEAYTLLVSNRSVMKLKTRFNFIRLCCPRKYQLKNYFAEMTSLILIISSIPPLWHLKISLLPLIMLLKKKHSVFSVIF